MGPLGARIRRIWSNLSSTIGQGVAVQARIDEDLAHRMDEWTQEHDASHSEVVRRALSTFLEEETERQRRIEEVYQALDDLEETGIFDPPDDDSWKASGGWS